MFTANLVILGLSLFLLATSSILLLALAAFILFGFVMLAAIPFTIARLIISLLLGS